MGLGQATFATVAIADALFVVPIPEHLSFAEAAALPVAFLTALYALEDVARLRPGERVLIHAAAGGVGMAAMQLAHLIGAEVFATASPAKWSVLEAMHLNASNIASSRDAVSTDSFLAITAGEGMDVVLGALAGDFVDASLRLLPRGGRYIEMGKTDVRDARAICEAHPGVSYHAIDLFDAGAERIHRLLQKLCTLLSERKLVPLRLTAYDLRHAPAAFRCMGNARHVGKLVLQPKRSVDWSGTVLITGGAGSLGQTVARHLVSRHGARHLVLTSRQGLEAPGAAAFVQELLCLGAETATLVRCEVTDREQVRGILDGIPEDRPLTAVFHLAGILDDGVVTELTRERLIAVLRPKVDGAWNLHQLTTHLDLSAFVLFSSAAGVLGGPGQANYAAANTFLDALAAHRRSQGLTGLSLAWGLWAPQGQGMTAHLTEIDLLRLRRQGLAPLSNQVGLRLLDAALERPEATLTPIELNTAQMKRLQAGGMAVPALLRAFVRPTLRKVSAASGNAAALRRRLAALPESERKEAMLSVVCEEVAVVLGAATLQSVSPVRSLKDLGLDSLMAVELRNRLSARAEVQLPATLAFDYPTPARIAGLLSEKLQLDESPKLAWSSEDIRRKLSRISIESLARSGLLRDLMECPDEPQPSSVDVASEKMRELIGNISDDSLLDLADRILKT
jgi:NADPH:quinone reductase-like Zn-dependent oxidoreductase/acyl carrier protein